jgi:hypothetical protein
MNKTIEARVFQLELDSRADRSRIDRIERESTDVAALKRAVNALYLEAIT